VETRVQFRVDEETKLLAQKAIARQGTTLSDACRKLAEQLAEDQRKYENHDTWITEQVNQAFDRIDSGEAKFVTHGEAKSIMAERKAAIRKKAV